MFRISPLLILIILLMPACRPGTENFDRSEDRRRDAAGFPAKEPASHFLVTDLGDTIPTGKAIPITGSKVHPDSVTQPSIIRVSSKPVVMPAPYKVRAAGTPRVVPVPPELRTVTPGKNGVPLPAAIPALPRDVQAVQPPPVPASTPVSREGAVAYIQRLGLGQGLSGHTVRSMMEDSRGNLWFGINGQGVSRYDGTNFINYRSEEGLIYDEDVYAMLEDSRGNLWFATDGGGVCRYDGVRFYHFTTDEGLSDNRVVSILEDKRGHLWFGTRRGGVTRYEPSTKPGVAGTLTHYTTKEGLSNNHVYSMLEDSRGDLWFGTMGGGACRLAVSEAGGYEGARLVYFTTREGLTGNFVSSMEEDDQGNIWFGTVGKGASRLTLNEDGGYDGAYFSHFTTREGLVHDNILYLIKDRRGRLWFGTYPGGASRYDPPAVPGAKGSFTQITTDEGLSSNYILSMLEDSRGNVWFGTLAGGINCYRNSGLTFYTEQQGLISNVVRSMVEDQRGNMWVGTFPGGLNQYQAAGDGVTGGRFVQHLTSTFGIIRAMLEDSRGNLWLAQQGRVWRCTSDQISNGKTGELILNSYTPKEGLSGYDIRSILEDRQGNIWLGTWNQGITRYDPASLTFTHYMVEGGLVDDRWNLRLTDSRGNIWSVTRGHGVSRIALSETGGYDTLRLTHYTTNEGLVSNRVGPVLEDSRGNLWFGTDRGAVCYRPANDQDGSIGLRLAHFTTQNGLLDNRVLSLTEDDEQNIWIATELGITMVPLHLADSGAPATDHHQAQTIEIGRGFKRGFGTRGIYQARSNQIWWGTNNEGLVRLDLDEFDPPATAPNIRLNTIEVAQTFIDYRRLADTAYRNSLVFGRDLAGTFDSVPPFSNYPLHLTLPHNLNQLSFDFSAIDWAASGILQYSYQLEGLDTQWSSPGPENKIIYRKLQPGKYTFRVRAIGATRVWSAPLEYHFRILPPWWLTPWAHLIYGLFAVFSLYLFYRFLLNRRLEYVEIKRLQELDALKTSLYTNITHEFRTPLTIILGMARQIREDPKQWYHEGLEMITRNGRQLLSLVNQMLDLSKLNGSKLELKMQQSEVVGFLHYLTQSFESFAASKNIRLHFLKEVDQLEMDFDPEQLTKVLGNLLSNAVKYTPEGGQVYVTIRRQQASLLQSLAVPGEEVLELRVQDTGPGIAPEELAYIFDRFYQIDRSTTRHVEGTGVGLALAKELVQLMGGIIQVQSKLGEGSVFSVLLPICRMAPKANVIRHSVPLFQEKLNGRTGMIDSRTPYDVGVESRRQWSPEASDRNLPIALLIEDNPDVLTYLASCLERNYQLEFAMNGQEGIEQALEIVPDIIISDVMMPEKDGYEVCATLKEDIRTSHIPIILLTAKADREAKLEGLRTGADAYLAKPFDKEELAIRLEKLLEVRRQLQSRYSDLNALSEVEKTFMSKEEFFLRNLRTTVEENLSKEIFGITQLCLKMNMSRSQLHKKLKALTGQSASHYIRAVRLARAKELLRSTDLTISEVAYEVGFRTPGYFTQVFTQVVGVAPSGFRNGDLAP